MFSHVWALWIGAAAVAAPVAIHLLTRPRPVRLPLSTLRFVREAVRQQRSRHVLRDLLILLMRTAAIVLLALAMARPQAGSRPLVSDSQPGDAVRVVILDQSQSMAATDRGVEAIERARTAAAGFLRYRPGLRANVILAGAKARPIFDRSSTNFDALRDALAADAPVPCRALPETLDVNAAFAAAAKMLAPQSENDTRRRELVIVSDFQRSNWGKASFEPLPKETKIQLESVAPAETPANVAILRVGIPGRVCRDRGVQLEVDVGNYSPAARNVAVEVSVGESTWRLQGACRAGRTTTLTQEIVLRHLGSQTGRARLADVDDALAADDAREFAVEVRPRPVYVLVTRQQASQRPSSSHFLECALLPDARRKEKASAEVLRMDPAELDRQRLASADVILLDHPGKLSAEAIKLFAGLLRRGSAMIYVTGESIDATNLKRLADASSGDLQMPVEFLPPPAGHTRRDLFIESVARDRRPLDAFGGNLTAVIRPLRFAGGLASRPLNNARNDDLLATFNDKSACMVLSASGKGKLAVINADLGTSNLPLTSAFVPIMDELIEHLLEQNQAGQAAGVPTAESPLAALPKKTLQEKLAGGRSVYYQGSAGEGSQRDDWWMYFTVACVICMLCELGLLLGFKA
ncbi:MAG: BatA domain-containing protein [Candidatus Nealsonbacteria bacterium]|nr:BatA domain-containing protein [Candidatus Nealsonbacteria bacterium]